MTEITTLPGFADALSKSVCANPNTRLNNMCMLRALNNQSMPEIMDHEKEIEAKLAYQRVQVVINRAEIGTLDPTIDPREDTTLTYDRFTAVMSEIKHHLLTVNS